MSNIEYFKQWIEDGNAFMYSYGLYVEQSTQYVPVFTLTTLFLFFKKEYINN